MVRIAFLLLAFFSPNIIIAQAVLRLELTEGSVLVYKVKQGAKSYNYIVTINSKEYDRVEFSWITSEPIPRKGTVATAPGFDETDVDQLLVTNFKTGEEELEYDQARLFVPYTIVSKIELKDEQKIDFNINEKTSSLNLVKGPVTGSKKLLYNKVAINTGYTELANKPAGVILGYTYFEISEDYLVSFYADKDISMQLSSVKTPIEEASKPSNTKPVEVAKKPALKKMDPSKFNSIKTKYPLLAKLENFDPTNNGAITKPFDETYEYRISSNTPNPPSLIDCFICDLKILYNQKNNFVAFAGQVDEPVAEKNFPSSAVSKLLQVYIKNVANKTPGYRPWTHHQFVNSLTESERIKLAKEVEEYVQAYGILEAR